MMLAKRDVEFFLPIRMSPLLKMLKGKNPFSEANHREKVIFIHIPKNAGRSICSAALGEPGKHVPLKRYYSYNSEAAKEYFKFSVVRNPVDRFVSAFYGLKNSPIRDNEYSRFVIKEIAPFDDIEDFGQWLEIPSNMRKTLRWLHFWPQYKWVSLGPNHPVMVDEVLRFETLGKYWNSFSSRHGFKEELPVIGKNRRLGNRQISKRLEAVVRNMYAKDIDLFGY